MAKRDPFYVEQRLAPEVVPAVVSSSTTPPLRKPTATPPLEYRFLGRVTAPDGKQRVYLAKEDRSVAVAVGDYLESGYRVDQITEEGVLLIHDALDEKLTIDIPERVAE